jgi:hypothetical protein
MRKKKKEKKKNRTNQQTYGTKINKLTIYICINLLNPWKMHDYIIYAQEMKFFPSIKISKY